MANPRSDRSFTHTLTHPSQSEKGSRIDQPSAARWQLLAALKENTERLRGLHGMDTIFQRSYFYKGLLKLLSNILSLIESTWSPVFPISQESLRSAFDRVRDLHVRWKIWHDDAFEPRTRVGSWESTEDFKRTTLCGLMIRNFDNVLIGLEGIALELQSICGVFRLVFPLDIRAAQALLIVDPRFE